MLRYAPSRGLPQRDKRLEPFFFFFFLLIFFGGGAGRLSGKQGFVPNPGNRRLRLPERRLVWPEFPLLLDDEELELALNQLPSTIGDY